MSRRKTLEDMQALASARGGVFLGPWVNSKTRARWRCHLGHEWETAASHIQQGSWCHVCGGSKPKTEAEVQALATAKGGNLLGPYINMLTKTSWSCALGHEWQATPANVSTGNWCPHCVGLAPKTSADMQALAAAKGGTFLGPLVNTQTKAGWRCHQGHEWQASPTNIQQGKWCPRCANVGTSKGQLQVLEFVCQVLPDYEVLSCNRSVLRNPKTGRPLELDIWIPALKTAIEYNGVFWHSREAPDGAKTVEKDLLKQELCAKNNIRLLTVWERHWNRERKAQEGFLRASLSVPRGFMG